MKLKLDKATLRERETFQLLLDFDVAKSIVERGNWKPGNDKKERYMLKPVIRVVAQDLRGGLARHGKPGRGPAPGAGHSHLRLLGPDTVSTRPMPRARTNSTAWPPVPTALSFSPAPWLPPASRLYRNDVRTGVVVTNDQVTDLGTTSLN